MGSNQLAKTKNNRSPRVTPQVLGCSRLHPHAPGGEPPLRREHGLPGGVLEGSTALGVRRRERCTATRVEPHAGIRAASVGVPFPDPLPLGSYTGLTILLAIVSAGHGCGIAFGEAPARLEQILEKQMAPPLLSGPLERCPSAEALYPGEKPGVYPRRRYGCAALPAPSSGRCGRLPHRGSGPVYRVRHLSRTW